MSKAESDALRREIIERQEKAHQMEANRGERGIVYDAIPMLIASKKFAENYPEVVVNENLNKAAKIMYEAQGNDARDPWARCEDIGNTLRVLATSPEADTLAFVAPEEIASEAAKFSEAELTNPVQAIRAVAQRAARRGWYR